MNKKQAEVEKVLLKHEKEAFNDLKKAYTNASKDIKARVLSLESKLKELQAIDTTGFDDRSKEILESQIQSKVYQLEYQKMLDKQIGSCIDVLKQDTVTNVSTYLHKMYEDSYLGSLYNINASGIPITTAINPSLLVATVNKPTGDMKFSKFGTKTIRDEDGLNYIQRIERNMNDFKKKVKSEISRGIANGSSYKEIASNLSMVTGEDLHVSQRIVRTEGARVSSEARLTQIRDAKEKGADLVKVWDSTLDGKTREIHAMLDQQVREVDEPFEVYGVKAMAPGMFGDPALDCNCRCVVLSVPRWDLEDKNIKYDNENGGLIETKNYQEWKQGYFRRITEQELENIGKDEIQKTATNILGKLVDFSLLNIEDERTKIMIENLTNLTQEYNTRLSSVSMDSLKKIKVAGDVDLAGNMRLSTKRRTTYTHEFAHSITQSRLVKYDLGNKTDKEFWEEANKLFKQYRKDLRELQRSYPLKVYDVKISDYSLENVDEFVAEGFTRAKLDGTKELEKDYAFNKKTLSPYATKILNLINKYYKK